ncbi:DUF3659 domain-containing protein, partial [Alteromonas sp. 14N.309.X.WAT.G.H12]|uniref:DUF3659 domain-containing protein n=1 Tax=Alteromonas sp. 14N.309.X.WAT.G.H12 TaxID=3120824 RepID=UPI002FCECBAA
MLENKKKTIFTPMVKRALMVSVAVLVVVVFLYVLVQRNTHSTVSRADNGEQRAGATQVKGTAFNGVDINTDDPAALRAYCEDIMASAEVSGDKIRDLCVLNDIVRKHIPELSSEEIQDLAKNHPSCLQTGYDTDGFNCFTGFNEDNCSREGLDPDGNVCDVSLAKEIIDPTETMLTGDVCSIVSGCQAESEFDENGMNRFGCNREGRREDGSICPAEYITRLYGDDNRDQLGFNPAGFNENGCDIQGLRQDGTRCPIEQVTRVYNRDNRDQWGFDPEGFNEAGCNLEGLDRDGNACSTEDITRVFDPKTGLDQFGMNPDGFNENGCSLEGFNKEGMLCPLSDITRIKGKDGKDQFGLYKNGRNDAGCDLHGLKPDGSACALLDAPRLFSPKTGKDQFGFYKNNKNEAGCDDKGMRLDGSLCPASSSSKIVGKDGLDAFGITLDGYAKNGCNTAGFRRNGKRCELDDIPRVFDPETGLDQFGLDEEGFDPKTGCNLDGFNHKGLRCELDDIPRIFDPETGLDQFGFLLDGYNQAGCDINGLNAMGEACSSSDITRVYDPETGLDQFGLDKDGFHSETGCNLEGYNRDGNRCRFEDIPKVVGKDGVNQLGLNADGRNAAGCDLNGMKPDGTPCTAEERTKLYGSDGMSQYHKDSNGFTRLGINDMQYNKFNCNLDGKMPNGELCDIDKITRVYDPETGLDQFGLDEDGFNEYGCSLTGENRDGEACPPENIPRIFSSDMKDQFGTPIEKLPDERWEQEKAKKEGLTPLLDENGKPVFINGKPAMVDKNGNVRDMNGVAFRDEYGGQIRVDGKGHVVDSQGETMPLGFLTDANGDPVVGLVKPAPNGNANAERLVDSEGNGVSVFGQEGFIDENGNVTDKNGNYILGKDGNPLHLDENGNIVDSKGNKIDAAAITNANGDPVEGPLSTKLVAEIPKLKSITDGDGEPITIDGKAAFVDANGNVVDAQGNPFTDKNGNPLRVNEKGEVVDGDGDAISDERLSTVSGKPVKKPLKVESEIKQRQLMSADGEPVTVDGKLAYVDSKGNIRDANGNIMVGKDGNPLSLDKYGRITDAAGVPISASRVKTISGKNVNRPITVRPDDTVKKVAPLTNEKGEVAYFKGKAVTVDANGQLRDMNNNPILGPDGEPLFLNKKGQVVNASGKVVPPEFFTDVKG